MSETTFKADGNSVFQRSTEIEGNISMGFIVCVVSEFLEYPEDAAQMIANALNEYEGAKQ